MKKHTIQEIEFLKENIDDEQVLLQNSASYTTACSNKYKLSTSHISSEIIIICWNARTKTAALFNTDGSTAYYNITTLIEDMRSKKTENILLNAVYASEFVKHELNSLINELMRIINVTIFTQRLNFGSAISINAKNGQMHVIKHKDVKMNHEQLLQIKLRKSKAIHTQQLKKLSALDKTLLLDALTFNEVHQMTNGLHPMKIEYDGRK